MPSIRWAESFENYAAPVNMLDGLWSALNTIGAQLVGDAATGLKCLQVPVLGNARRYLGDDFTRAAVALHFNVTSLPANANHTFGLIGFRNQVGAQVLNLRIISTGRIQLIAGAISSNPVVVATSRLAASAGVWNHVELVADTDTKQVDVYLNGKIAITTNVGTLGGVLSEVALGVFNTGTSNLFSPTKYDNIIAQGGDDTDPIGLKGVYYLQPVDDGTPQDWQLTSGSEAWPLINELVPDDDLNYIFTGTIDAVASFEVEPLPLNIVEVDAVIPIARVRKTDTGECDVALGVISDGTPAEGDDLAVTTGYSYQFHVFEEDPSNNSAWTPGVMPNISIRRAL